MDTQHTKHVTYKLAYHFVWCPTYRKKLLVGKLATFVEQELRRICEAKQWSIGALNVQPDHVHLFLIETFQKAFSQEREPGRRDDCEYGTPHVVPHMHTLEAVGSVLDDDGKGGYRFDRMGFNSPLDILDSRLRSMSGQSWRKARKSTRNGRSTWSSYRKKKAGQE